MRLRPFVCADMIRRASERHLPEDEQRQALAFVEQRLERPLTDAERARFIQVAGLAPQMIPGDDPVELRPVRRMYFASGHSTPGTKGGQLHSAVELERDAMAMAWAVAICAAVPLGIAIAQGMAWASIKLGESLWFLF